MKKYKVLMLAIIMVNPFTAFADISTCKIETHMKERPEYAHETDWADDNYGEENYIFRAGKFDTYYALVLIDRRDGTRSNVSTSTRRSVLVAKAKTMQRNEQCIYSGTAAFFTNGDEVDLDSLD